MGGVTGFLDLAFGFIQFFSMLGSFDVEWPPEWQTALSITASIGLDLNSVRRLVPVPTDVRTEFTIIVTFIPIGFAFISLLLFKSITVVLWYFLLLLGLSFVLAAAISTGFSVRSGTGLSEAARAEKSFFILGGVLAGVCLLVGLMRWYRHRRYRDEIRAHEELKDVVERETSRFPKGKSLSLIFAGIGLTVAGFFGQRAIEDGPVNVFLRKGGTVLAVLGVILFIYGILLISKWCRVKFWHLRSMTHYVSLKLILLAITITYLPVCTNLVRIFFCKTVTCPEGFRHYDDSANTGRIRAQGCEACAFTISNVTLDSCTSQLASDLCPVASSWRYAQDESITCSSIAIFFWPAAVLAAMAFLVGVPYLFFDLIFSMTRKLVIANNVRSTKTEKNLTLNPTDDSEGDRDKWSGVLSKTNCVSKSLFEHYTLVFRSWRVIMTGFKLLVVVSSLVLTLTSIVASGFLSLLMLAFLHGFAFFFVLFAKPYLSKAEGRMALTLYLLLCVNYIISCCLKAGVISPTSGKGRLGLLVLLILNLVVPLLTFFLTLLSLRGQKKKKDKPKEVNQTEGFNSVNPLDPPNIPEVVTGDYNEMKVESVAGDAHYTEPIVPAAPSYTNTDEAWRRKRAKKKTKEEQYKATDLQLNEETGNILTKFFIISGVVSFLSFACCLVGILYAGKYSSLVRSDPTNTTPSIQYAGYKNWQEFASNCCCTMNDPVTQRNITTATTEKWICRNGNAKLRFRGETSSQSDPVRSFCSKTFKLGCAPVETRSLTSLKCTNTRDELLYKYVW